MAETRTVTPAELLVGIPLSLIAGLLIGALGTFKQQFGMSPTTGAGLPIGLVASLALVAALLIGMRRLLRTRLYATAAGAGVIAAVAVLTLPGPGGSVVVVGDWVGVVWTVAPAIVAIVVLFTPRIRRRTQKTTLSA
jgi:peptidoglycan/LPS O-acetylase OafA/YrhL